MCMKYMIPYTVVLYCKNWDVQGLTYLSYIDCGYSLESARQCVLTCIHSQCFEQKHEQKFKKIFQLKFSPLFTASEKSVYCMDVFS